MDRDSKALECLLCRERYSEQDISNHMFWVETRICSACYAAMQRPDRRRSCFGKPTVRLPSGKVLHAYNPRSEECRRICPDRKICALIMLGGRDDNDGKI